MTYTEIADRIGTPVYIYDAARIEHNFRRLAAAFAQVDGSDVHLHYSVKANGNLSILRLLRELGAGFDVVSAGEMNRALRAGARPADIVFAGVGKRDDELIAALDAAVGWINVESAQELRVLSDLAAARGARQRVALRINPDVDAHTHRHLATGKGTSKFGIEVDEALALVADRASYPGIAIEGVHIHIGSMVAESEPYAAAVRAALDFVTRGRALGAAITALDLGGGFAVAYQPGQPEAPVEAIARAIVPPVRAAGLALLLEPGRAIVADAGVLLTRVLYTKTNGGARYAVVDAAMNDLIRPALYGAKHAVTKVAGGETAAEVSIVGPVCESGDALAERMLLPLLNRGDLLAIHHAGAYGMSMASNYNTRGRAAEVLVDAAGGWRVVRERETVEEMLASEMRALA